MKSAMKSMVILGWVLFGIEALLVLSFFVSQNVGDDAAGRGMATGFGIVLAPILLGAGALMLWGQRTGPKGAFWAGLVVVALPLIFIAVNQVSGGLTSIDRAMYQRQLGKFDQPQLTALARAIDKGDVVQMRALLAKGPVDFAARDRVGRTILGHAIHRVMDDYTHTSSIEAVRVLLDAGAPPAENALAPERTPAAPEGNLLLINLVGSRNEPLLELLLSAGLSPNGVDMDGRPAIFSMSLTMPALEALTRHGANLRALDVRPDRPSWSALMNAAYMSSWDEAIFFLDRGVPVDYVAPDGNTLATILKESESKAKSYGESLPPGYLALVARLQRK